MSEYVRYDPPRPLAAYRDSPGPEMGGLALSPMALDALAESVTSGKPPEFVVIGEWRQDDSRRYLDFAVSTAYLEATTDYRYDRDARRMRLVCPACGLKDGKHTRGCDA